MLVIMMVWKSCNPYHGVTRVGGPPANLGLSSRRMG